jgi:carboxypeptidase C (cathepsin A)
MSRLIPRILLLAGLAGCAHPPVEYGAPATAAAAPPPAAATQEATPIPAETPLSGLQFPYVTKGRGVFNGQSLNYTATVDGIVVEDAEGAPGAQVVSTSYVVDAPPGSTPRPVMFVFNGGPISPSIYLHLGAFGPKRLAFADDLSVPASDAPLVDNPYSILDAADLVYFDPAGTGFSRALPGKPLNEYFSIAADAQQTAAFIQAWLEQHHRLDSPAYIFGESYGTNRAVETAGQLAGMEPPVLLRGVVLFGQAVNIIEYSQRPSNIMSYVVSLPTLAALGWYHGKAEAGDATLEQFTNAAWEYARDDYLDALFQGNTLSDEALHSVAQRLQKFTGVDAQVFIDKRLRLSKEAYRVELFKAGNKVIGRSDGRYVGDIPLDESGKPIPGSDPANVLPNAIAGAYKAYLVDVLGLPSAEQYLTGSPVQGLDGWEWGGASPFDWFQYGDALGKLLAASPQTRVVVAAGYYDTMTTLGASQYLIDQESWPRGQVSLKAYPGGHMAYSIAASAEAMASDLRGMIRDSIGAQQP